jgi:hypothetical protein
MVRKAQDTESTCYPSQSFAGSVFRHRFDVDVITSNNGVTIGYLQASPAALDFFA